jgi:hypothetical protein
VKFGYAVDYGKCRPDGIPALAFNGGEMEEPRQLSEFAVAVCPEIKRSLARVRLTSKRLDGRAETWPAVRPAPAAIRAVQGD